MYKVVRKVENGEILLIATVDDLKKANQLLREFKEHWPGDYSIQEAASSREIDPDLRD
jgi:hypothetical protein